MLISYNFEHQILILSRCYELSCLIKQRIFYVFTTAGRSFLIAIIFLNQVYFETMNHYASLLFSYAVFLPFSCLIKQRIILYPLSGKEYLISYYLLNQLYFETMNIMPLCFHMLSSPLPPIQKTGYSCGPWGLLSHKVRKSYIHAVLQGMSDLLSPILFVMDDESEAFWCFVALMERLGPNFNRDQNGMHSQLFALSKVFLFFLFFTSHSRSPHC